ncbi:MAG: radical SAM protein [Melioribacteraceae bacterium]|nr:radical SAM protein [Melioribacteraceae bacterium]
MEYLPSYIKLSDNEFLERINKAYNFLNSCNVCPRDCKVDRYKLNTGFCQSGILPIVSSYTLHFGEEPVLSGTNGAGNIFFGNCNMKCLFCQNYEISQNWKEEIKNEISCERLADIMIELQNQKCHNIGLVSPTHFSPQTLKSIFIAKQKGLHLPVIYNSNGYDSFVMLKLFDGIIDIYLPDLKYGNNLYGKKYSFAPNYFDFGKEALKEMYRQVGDKLIYDGDIVVRGLIIRHLVLPNELAETEEVFKFIAEELSPNVHISLMSQYFPTNKANNFILLNRKIRFREYEKAIQLLEKYGLRNGWIQEMDSPEHYLPNFQDRNNPFNN